MKADTVSDKLRGLSKELQAMANEYERFQVALPKSSLTLQQAAFELRLMAAKSYVSLSLNISLGSGSNRADVSYSTYINNKSLQAKTLDDLVAKVRMEMKPDTAADITDAQSLVDAATNEPVKDYTEADVDHAVDVLSRPVPAEVDF